MLDPARLVFIDETAVSTNLARVRGRAPKGDRVIGTVPLCVQRRLACSAGDKPAGVEVRAP